MAATTMTTTVIPILRGHLALALISFLLKITTMHMVVNNNDEIIAETISFGEKTLQERQHLQIVTRILTLNPLRIQGLLCPN